MHGLYQYKHVGMTNNGDNSSVSSSMYSLRREPCTFLIARVHDDEIVHRGSSCRVCIQI
jgi:hypothetical protein